MPDLTIDPVACNTCKAPIFLATNLSNAAVIPFDAVPSPDGAFRVKRNFAGRLVAEGLSMARRFGAGELYRPHGNNCRRRPPSRAPHAFEPDPEVAADFHGRRWCRCGLPGEPGDDRHPHGALPIADRQYPPTPAAAAEIDARRLGESGQ